jgi:hypothetical protein
VIQARRIGAIVLALAAIVVWFAMGPEDRGGDIDRALREAELNEANAQGAPQQAVVNGWVTRDLLTIIAQEQNDERVPALAGLLVLGVALYAFTAPSHVATPAGPAAPEPPADGAPSFVG